MLPPSCLWDNRRVQQGLTGWHVFLPHGQTSSLTHSVCTASPAPVPLLVSRLSPGCERGQQGQQPPWLLVNTAAQDPQRPARRLHCQNPSVGAALHPCQHTEDKHTALSHMLLCPDLPKQLVTASHPSQRQQPHPCPRCKPCFGQDASHWRAALPAPCPVGSGISSLHSLWPQSSRSTSASALGHPPAPDSAFFST